MRNAVKSRTLPAGLFILLVAGLLSSMPAEAQQLSCGGHRIQWAGGAPRGSAKTTSDSDGKAPGASFVPTHQDGQQPTIDEPAGLDREVWDALVFDTNDYGYFYVSQTVVLDRRTVPTIRICIQSPETSTTGKRLEPYSKPSWWRRHIRRWTDLGWNGEIRIAACTGEPPEGWIYLREGDPGEVPPDAGAHAVTRRDDHPHNGGGWLWSELVWNPDHVGRMEESFFEKLVAHELAACGESPG